MSKTIRKIPWAVPGLAAVALAAFLAIGLLATYGVQPVAAQDADCVVANTLADVNCTVSGDMATIEFIGSTAVDTATTRHVYVVHDGGQYTRYPADTTYTPAAGVVPAFFSNEPVKFDYQTVDIAAPEVKELVLTASSTTITVTSGTVYVYTALATYDAVTGTDVPEDADLKFAAAPGATVTITFLGAPVLEDSAGAVRSDLTATDIVDGVVDIDDDSDDEIVVTAAVRDADGNALEGQISYSVAYAPGSALKGGRSDYMTPLKDYPGDSDANTTVSVDGWEDTGAVRVTVSARFEGGTGSLDLTPIELTRTGDAAMITSTVYECATDCAAEAQALANDEADDDPSEAGAFDPGAIFMIHSTAVDSLGSVKTIGFSAAEVVAEGAEAALDAIGEETGAVEADGTTTPPTLAAVAYIQHTLPAADDIALGAYTIMVQDADENAETTVAIIVSGPPEFYVLTGLAFIPLVAFSSADYTVTVTDANGNPPTGDNTVDIIVQGIDASDVTGAGTDVPLGADGTVMFSIRVPFGAMQGDQAAIGVLVDGELKDRLIVTFGEEVAPEPMLTAPTDVTATAEAGTVTVTWTDGADAEGHLVLLFNADFSGAPMVSAAPTGSSAEFMDVAAGDYVAVVVSYRSGSEYMYDYMLVTVN